jgi:uncharacterized membrane protein
MRAVLLSHRWRWLLIGAVVAAAGFTLRETAWRWRPVDYAEARTVVNRRCLECHSERPTNRAFPFPPKGIMLDTAMQMQQYAQRIEETAAVERTMPIANMSGMTEEERWILGRWVKTGAKVR